VTLTISGLQRQILLVLADEDGVMTEELLAILGISHEAFRQVAESLGERPLVFARVAPLSPSGQREIIPAGREAL
jgi:hypothetical protein